MATKGTRGTAIAFGGYEITVSMKKANGSRDLKTEVVDAAGVKVSGGGGWGGGRRALRDGESRAVRRSETDVVRLPQDELNRIETESKNRWSKMEVLEVIDYRQVPTERITAAYWLQPAQGSVKGVALLARTLRDAGKVAVVKWVSSSREKLGVIRVRGERGRMALLLSEVSFANDFLAADEDALAINEVIDELDERSLATARGLIEAWARDGEPAIDAASDTAVDARLVLFERLCAEQTERELAAAAATTGEESEPEPEGADVVHLDTARAAA